MTKVPLPRGKGEPPAPTNTIGNLDRPETEELVSLNFRVPKQFRRDFKIFAAQNDRDGIDALKEVFSRLMYDESGIEALSKLQLKPLKR